MQRSPLRASLVLIILAFMVALACGENDESGHYSFKEWVDSKTSAEICNWMRDKWEGDSIQGAFGVETTVLKIYDDAVMRRISEKRVECRASAKFSRGDDGIVIMATEEDDDGDWFGSLRIVRQ